MHGVESNRKGSGNRGQAPEERKSLKEGGRVMLKEMKPCVTTSTVKESCVTLQTSVKKLLEEPGKLILILYHLI